MYVYVTTCKCRAMESVRSVCVCVCVCVRACVRVCVCVSVCRLSQGYVLRGRVSVSCN